MRDNARNRFKGSCFDPTGSKNYGSVDTLRSLPSASIDAIGKPIFAGAKFYFFGFLTTGGSLHIMGNIHDILLRS
jgi:hypothetical protein